MCGVRGAGIGLVFQEPMAALNPVMRVGAQVAEALVVHGLAGKREARARAIELLRAVKIVDPEKRVDDYPHQLSGGMRQRVMLAVALACKPPLVIADEPTTALDVTVQAQILDLLREMKRTFDLSLLLITHDLGVIAEVADRVAVMYAGRIVEEGPVRAIFRAPGPSLHARAAGVDSARARRRAAGRHRGHRAEPGGAAARLRLRAALRRAAARLRSRRAAGRRGRRRPSRPVRAARAGAGGLGARVVSAPLVEVRDLTKHFTRGGGLFRAARWSRRWTA